MAERRLPISLLWTAEKLPSEAIRGLLTSGPVTASFWSSEGLRPVGKQRDGVHLSLLPEAQVSVPTGPQDSQNTQERQLEEGRAFNGWKWFLMVGHKFLSYIWEMQHWGICSTRRLSRFVFRCLLEWILFNSDKDGITEVESAAWTPSLVHFSSIIKSWADRPSGLLQEYEPCVSNQVVLLRRNITGKLISTGEKSTKKAKNLSPSCFCHCIVMNHGRN